MNRYLLSMLLTFFLLFSSMSISITGTPNWIIDGDTVYIDDENAYLSATPHTIIQDTWVTFQFKSKDYEGNIDACWLFDTTKCKPTKPVYYKVGEGDWQILTKEFTVETIDYENMTKAYLLENINIQSNTDYYLKCFVDIKFNTVGKYWWGVKPSALGWNNGYYIDPWWNSSWAYYRPVTINSGYIDTDLVNYPLLIPIPSSVASNSQANGEDSRPVSTDNTTEFYYQIEEWNASGTSYAWVNISEAITSGGHYTFLWYYGNPTAPDNQNMTNVWDSNYSAVYHMNDNTTSQIQDSTINDRDGSKKATNTPYEDSGKIGLAQIFNYTEWITIAGANDLCPYEYDWTIEFWIYFTNVYANDYNDNRVLRRRLNANEESYIKVGANTLQYYAEKGGVANINAIESFVPVNLTWYHFVFVADRDTSCYIYDNVTSLSLDTNTITENDQDVGASMSIGDLYGGGDVGFNGTLDELRFSNCVRNASWIKASYHNQNQTQNPSFLTWGEQESGSQIITNATTGIELTNVTANGYFFGAIFSGNYNYGFWIGQTSPVTEGNAEQNVTGAGTITAPSTFSYNITSLSKGTHYYVTAWVMNNSGLTSSADEDDFYTKCDTPSGFTATLSGCNADLAWTKGDGADQTTIVRKADSYPTNQTDGTVVYNNTGTSYSDTTASGSHQYYNAWSWTGDKFSDSNVTADLLISPCPPTNVIGTTLGNNTLQINWTKGSGANTTMVRKKMGSYPSSTTDGTQLYNNTGTSVIETDFPQEWYFRLWSYANQTYSSSVDLEFGALFINCFDEETNANLTFNIFISDREGTQTYSDTGCTNTHTINLDELPTGEQTSIQIEAFENYNAKSETFTDFLAPQNNTITYIQLEREPIDKASTNVTCLDTTGGTESYPVFILNEDIITIYPDMADEFDKITVNYTYEEYGVRFYYMDIYANNVYTLNAYLPSTALKDLYFFRVLDSFSQPVPDAKINVKRFINATQQFENITILYTDGNGRCSIYLLPGNYKVIINKTGYAEEVSDYIPNEIEATFRLLFEEVPIEPEETLWDNIVWSIEPTEFQHTSNITLYFNISSSDNKIEWFRASVYYYNDTNVTWVLLYSQNVSSSSGGSISYTTPNITGKYSFTCTFKKENFSAYTFGAMDGCRFYIIFWRSITGAIEGIPAFAWLILTVVFMLAGTGVSAKFGAGDLSGIVGIAIMGGMFALRPELSFSGVSVWFIFLATAIAYLIVMFLLRGRT